MHHVIDITGRATNGGVWTQIVKGQILIATGSFALDEQVKAMYRAVDEQVYRLLVERKQEA